MESTEVSFPVSYLVGEGGALNDPLGPSLSIVSSIQRRDADLRLSARHLFHLIRWF